MVQDDEMVVLKEALNTHNVRAGVLFGSSESIMNARTERICLMSIFWEMIRTLLRRRKT